MANDCLTCMVLGLVVLLHCLQGHIAGTFIHLEQGNHLLIDLQALSIRTWSSVAVQDVYTTDLVFLVVLGHLDYISVAHVLLLGLSYRVIIAGQVSWKEELLHVLVGLVRRYLPEVLMRLLLREGGGEVVKLNAVLPLLLPLALIVDDLVARRDHRQRFLRWR